MKRRHEIFWAVFSKGTGILWRSLFVLQLCNERPAAAAGGDGVRRGEDGIECKESHATLIDISAPTAERHVIIHLTSAAHHVTWRHYRHVCVHLDSTVGFRRRRRLVRLLSVVRLPVPACVYQPASASSWTAAAAAAAAWSGEFIDLRAPALSRGFTLYVIVPAGFVYMSIMTEGTILE